MRLCSPTVLLPSAIAISPGLLRCFLSQLCSQSFQEDRSQSRFPHHVEGEMWIFSPFPSHVGTYSPPSPLVYTILTLPEHLKEFCRIKKGWLLQYLSSILKLTIEIYPLQFFKPAKKPLAAYGEWGDEEIPWESIKGGKWMLCSKYLCLAQWEITAM